MKLEKLNQLQMPTWRWLNMNEAALTLEADFAVPFTGGSIQCKSPLVQLQTQAEKAVPENLPRDIARVQDFVWQQKNHSLTITIPQGVKLAEPIYLNFTLSEGSPVLTDYLHIIGEADSSAEVVVTYSSDRAGRYFHSGFSLVQAKPGAQIVLTKVQMLGSRDTHLDINAVDVEENALGNLLICELGGAQVVSGCNIRLAHTKSCGKLDSIYLGSGTMEQDFSYRLELGGAASEGEITVQGALAGNAKKVLKSTLDFLRGAAGAVGKEKETVLSLSENAVNLSTPLLLCGEADVVGAHESTSGKPDAGKLYYLMSRGLSEKEAKRLLVEASFTPVLNRLQSEALREAVLKRIQEVVHYGG